MKKTTKRYICIKIVEGKAEEWESLGNSKQAAVKNYNRDYRPYGSWWRLAEETTVRTGIVNHTVKVKDITSATRPRTPISTKVELGYR